MLTKSQTQKNNVWRLNYVYSLKHFMRSWFFWLILGICCFVIFFALVIMPLIFLKSNNISEKYVLYYGGSSWIAITFPVVIVVIIAYGSLIGTMNANNKENIYILAGMLKRNKLLFSKCLSSLTLTLPLSIIVYLFFTFMNLYISNKHIQDPNESYSIYTASVTWYGLLLTLIICSLFSCLNTIISYCINGAFSAIGIIAIILGFFVLIPMIFDDVGSSNPSLFNSTAWYISWAWIFCFFPIASILAIIFTHIFIKVRINI